ncbi:hypothetical protein ACWDWO_08035 [Actinopolymorpha singaporensis]
MTITQITPGQSRAPPSTDPERPGHLSSTDWGLLAEGLGVRRQLPPEGAAQQYGTIGSARGVRITRAYVAAFFDAKLRGERAPLLTGPSRAYPEISFKVPR